MIIVIWWMMTYHNAFIPQTVLFFCLGAYFSIQGINPLQMISNQKIIFITLFLLFGIGDIVAHTLYDTSINLQIHRFSLILNIPALLLLADYCSRSGFSCQLLPNAAFIVFCVHYPIVVVIRKLCISKFATAPDSIHIFLYFVSIAVATLLSILLYLILNKYFPRLKNILSGNR